MTSSVRVIVGRGLAPAEKAPPNVCVLDSNFVPGGIYEPMFAPKVAQSVRATCANYAGRRFAPSGEGSNREAIRQIKAPYRFAVGCFYLAERQGFEPWYPVEGNTISSRAPSTTRPSLHIILTTCISYHKKYYLSSIIFKKNQIFYIYFLQYTGFDKSEGGDARHSVYVNYACIMRFQR